MKHTLTNRKTAKTEKAIGAISALALTILAIVAIVAVGTVSYPTTARAEAPLGQSQEQAAEVAGSQPAPTADQPQITEMTESAFLAGKSENSLEANTYYWVPETDAAQNGPEWVTENGTTFLSMKGDEKDAYKDKTAVRAYRVFPVPPDAGSVTVRANMRVGYNEWADKSSRNSGCPYMGFLFAKGAEEAGYATMLFRRVNIPITPNEGMVAVDMAYGDKNWKTVSADKDIPKDAKILIVEIGVDSPSSLDLKSLDVKFAKKYPITRSQGQGQPQTQAPAAGVAGSQTAPAEGGQPQQPQFVKLTESSLYYESNKNSLEENIYYWVPRNEEAEKGPEWVTENGATFLSMKGGSKDLIAHDYPEWASKNDKTFVAVRGQDWFLKEIQRSVKEFNAGRRKAGELDERIKIAASKETDPLALINWGMDNQEAFRVMKNGYMKTDTSGTYVGIYRAFRVPPDTRFVTVQANIRADYNQWVDKSDENGGSPSMMFSFMKGAEEAGGRTMLHRFSNRPEASFQKAAEERRRGGMGVPPAIAYGDKNWTTLTTTASVPKGAKILIVHFGVDYASSLDLKSLDVTFEK